MIYGRFGDPCEIVRLGTLADVRRLDRRKPDAQDREAVRLKAYVVVNFPGDCERLYHLAFLRADGGALEIRKAIDAL